MKSLLILLPLLLNILFSIIYSIAGAVWNWMRTWLIAPLLLIIMLSTGIFDIRLLYPILLGASFIIGYGYNCPLSKSFRKIGWTDEFKIKFTVRAINALAISGSAIVLAKWLVFACNMAYFVPLYIYLGVYNPCKNWFGIQAARWEEFFICFFSLLVPLYMIWR